MAEEKKRKNCLISSKFLGCKELDSTESVTSDIELGGFLHNMGRRRLIWRKSKCAALAFVDKSFVITFNYHKQDKKVQVCDLRDVSKVSVHPTRERVVGFLLSDRQSHQKRFLCFELCRNANMNGQEFKNLHQKRLQLHHPKPKVKRPRVQQNQKEQQTPLLTKARQLKAKKPQLLDISPPSKHKNETSTGLNINGKLVKVVYRTPDGEVSVVPSQTRSKKSTAGHTKHSPIYENLLQHQETLPQN